ncbi:uncharacterized protein G2W53_042962 [Senna tora]|uniref:Uncharacterized protein n=1 Tax=Senna tora TaxID=362788 RepID=A0A834SHW0_9FABA|nr:uncharacterized protein G2W53_042962 [Senna tora]
MWGKKESVCVREEEGRKEAKACFSSFGYKEEKGALRGSRRIGGGKRQGLEGGIILGGHYGLIEQIMYDKDKHTNILLSLCNSFVSKHLDVNGMQKRKLQIPLILGLDA